MSVIVDDSGASAPQTVTMDQNGLSRSGPIPAYQQLQPRPDMPG